MADRECSVGFWVVVALEMLKVLKLVTGGGKYSVTPKGIATFDQLDSDFYPTNAEIAYVLPSVTQLI